MYFKNSIIPSCRNRFCYNLFMHDIWYGGCKVPVIFLSALSSIKIEHWFYSWSCSNRVKKARVSENMVTLTVLFCWNFISYALITRQQGQREQDTLIFSSDIGMFGFISQKVGMEYSLTSLPFPGLRGSGACVLFWKILAYSLWSKAKAVKIET